MGTSRHTPQKRRKKVGMLESLSICQLFQLLSNICYSFWPLENCSLPKSELCTCNKFTIWSPFKTLPHVAVSQFIHNTGLDLYKTKAKFNETAGTTHNDLAYSLGCYSVHFAGHVTTLACNIKSAELKKKKSPVYEYAVHRQGWNTGIWCPLHEWKSISLCSSA